MSSIEQSLEWHLGHAECSKWFQLSLLPFSPFYIWGNWGLKDMSFAITHRVNPDLLTLEAKALSSVINGQPWINEQQQGAQFLNYILSPHSHTKGREHGLPCWIPTGSKYILDAALGRQELSHPGMHLHKRPDIQSDASYTTKGALLCPLSQSTGPGRWHGMLWRGKGCVCGEKGCFPGPLEKENTLLSHHAWLVTLPRQCLHTGACPCLHEDRQWVLMPLVPDTPLQALYSPEPQGNTSPTDYHLPLMISFLDTRLLVRQVEGIMRGKIKP